MRRNQQSGFTLVEIMAALAMIAVVAVIVIPTFTDKVEKAKAVEGNAELERISKAAKAVFLADGSFPQGTATTLPGNDGAACGFAAKKFPTTPAWRNDLVWGTLDFAVTAPTQFSYHYESIDANTAVITAVADLNCTGTLTKFTMTLTGADGNVVAAIAETNAEIVAEAEEAEAAQVAAAAAAAPSDPGTGGGGASTGGAAGGATGGTTTTPLTTEPAPGTTATIGDGT